MSQASRGTFAGSHVAAVAGHALGAPCRAPVRITKGLANENWRVRTSLGDVLVKIGYPGADPEKWQASARALELARAAGVPAPRLLHAQSACAALDGRVLRIQSWVDGVSPELLDAPAAERFWRALGRVVQALHGIAMPGFSSRLDDSAPTFASWSAYIAWRVPQVERRCAAAQVLDPRRRAMIWREVEALAEEVDPVVRACFVHRDLHPDNLIASPAGEVAAVLDFDMVEAWDPVAEWFKLEHWCFEPAPAAREAAFELGYGVPGRRYDGFAERRRLVERIEWANLAANAALHGDRRAVAQALRRLEHGGRP